MKLIEWEALYLFGSKPQYEGKRTIEDSHSLHTSDGRRLLWELDDYKVSSVSGNLIWLKKRIKNDPSLPRYT